MLENKRPFVSRTIQYLHRCLKTIDPLCREQYNIFTLPKLLPYRQFPTTDYKTDFLFTLVYKYFHSLDSHNNSLLCYLYKDLEDNLMSLNALPLDHFIDRNFHFVSNFHDFLSFFIFAKVLRAKVVIRSFMKFIPTKFLKTRASQNFRC